MTQERSGPLCGVRVIELAGLGPAPHAAMVLADLGADVVRIERPAGPGLDVAGMDTLLLRGRRTLTMDLKKDEDRDDLLSLLAVADVLVEGLRPGVAERLGIGPDACLAANPRLVYGRVTGWGQTGPMAGDVGHDINYIGLTGALHAMGSADRPPTPPLNVVGDFGGGSMLLLVGVLAALVEREGSGRGQVIDAAMVDGTALLSQLVLSLRSSGVWNQERGDNLLDGGAPFYSTYRCSDGRYVAVGALEPRFFDALSDGLGLAPSYRDRRWDRLTWPELRAEMTARFATRERDAWVAHFSGTEACVTPVLDFEEAARHPHLVARGTYLTDDGILRAAPAPRFSRSGPPSTNSAAGNEVDASAVLAEWQGARSSAADH
jgi:alpha-methylacyl-CoA racemase